MTGLPNRSGFQARFKQAMSPGAERLGLCIVNVDRFSVFNDLHGREAGDALLCEVGQRLLTAVRSTDVVARLGGDEFAVVFAGLQNRPDLERRVSTLIGAIRESLTCLGHPVPPSVSVGACLSGARAHSWETLLGRADAALSKARLDGRDRFCLFRPSLTRSVSRHDRLIEEVRSALGRDQLEVHYQPIVDLRTRVVRGWEALTRWRHPARGLLFPSVFGAAFSDPRTSIAIDDFVLDTSLRQMRQWLDRGVPVTCAGVNFSEGQLKRPDIVDRVVSLLAHYRLTPDRLKIEVVETVLVNQATEVVAKAIERLARLGVVSALDDFGTGHASLTHLKRFKVERIKIDRSFVKHIETDKYDQAIVRCLTNLGRDLGMRVTAEGVENPRQLSILRSIGCDVGQGFLFGRAMHPDEVPGFLERWYAGEAAAIFETPVKAAKPPLQLVR